MSLELLHEVLTAHQWLSLREVLRLILLSALLSICCGVAFPKNAASRRVLLLMGIVCMALLPWLLQAINLQWYLPVDFLPVIQLGMGVPNLLVGIWILVAMTLVARHLRHVYQELKRIWALPRVCDPDLAAEVRDLRDTLLPNYPNLPLPEVCTGDQACATTLGGALLVLPGNWRTFSTDTRRSVLAHELTHIARCDDRWLLLLRLLLLCYWWMPWLRKLQQVYVQSMEESCDDVASELIGRHHSYAQALFEVALHGSSIGSTDPQHRLFAHMRGHPLIARVARFTQRRPLELDTAGVFWALMLITLSVTWVSGVKPVLADKEENAVDPVLFHQLSAPLQAESFVYPLVKDQSASLEPGFATPGRLRRPVELVSAVYPGRALADGQEHEVSISFAVAADGAVVQPKAQQQDDYGFAQSALRAVSSSRYQPLHKLNDIQSNSVATRRAADARKMTVSPHVKPVRYERKFFFRIERRS
ncbi:MAG: energy transducer TonB [Pseudomonadaceae bacterium]|nr:energy transducer TonB [Pseudomonadaceae bacterium]